MLASKREVEYSIIHVHGPGGPVDSVLLADSLDHNVIFLTLAFHGSTHLFHTMFCLPNVVPLVYVDHLKSQGNFVSDSQCIYARARERSHNMGGARTS